MEAFNSVSKRLRGFLRFGMMSNYDKTRGTAFERLLTPVSVRESSQIATAKRCHRSRPWIDPCGGHMAGVVGTTRTV